jgi:hypothetical protein
MKTPNKAHPKSKPEEWNDTNAVDEFLRKLDPRHKRIVEAIRSTVLSVDSDITEGIKWNSPSFYCDGWFATANVRGKEVVVVLHKGAKVKDNSTSGMRIEDSAGLLEWAAKERALARFSSLEDFAAKGAAFKSVVSQWIKQMKG